MFCRITVHETAWSNILGDYCSSANHGPSPDDNTGQNNRSSPNGSTIFNDCLREGVGILFTSRKLIICKSCVGTNKYIVAHAHTVPQLDPALNSHSVPDDNVILNQYMSTDVAF